MEKNSLYEQAMHCIDDLVDYTINMCIDAANKNHLEPEWVLDRFREKFNQTRKKGQNE